MGILDRFRGTKETVPDFEFRTVEQIKEEKYDFELLGSFGFSTDWTEHCMGLRIHEYPTLDFVRALAKYTTERSKELLEGQQRPLRVLEVAAGAGYIALGVRRQLDELHDGHSVDIVEWRAVDSNAYGYSKGVLQTNGVVVGDYKDELKTYEPDIVFGAAIPHDEAGPEWTEEFAKAGIKEYLLTGYNEARSTSEDDSLYMIFLEDGYTQVVPDDFDGTQLSIRSHKDPFSDEIIPNTRTLSFRLDSQAA